ncbi:hypothetical protein CRM22_006846, partial [Opisthorchis felineus]
KSRKTKTVLTQPQRQLTTMSEFGRWKLAKFPLPAKANRYIRLDSVADFYHILLLGQPREPTRL